MATTHAIPDTFAEMQATWGDLGPAVIVSHTGLTVPASSLTLTAVAANGYVLATGPPARLVYVSQPAVSLTLSGGNGQYWLALHTDVSTAVAGWTRRSGSHYVWQMNATQPAHPAHGLVFCQVTVAGGVISAVTPIASVTSPPMSQQNSHAVAITGGTATLAGGTQPLVVTGNATVTGTLYANTDLVASRNVLALTYLGVGVTVVPSCVMALRYPKNSLHGYIIQPSDADTGGGWAVVFNNAAGSVVGSITTTASATAFNTASDTRLKSAITPLTGATDVVRALRPVEFVWKSDDAPGVGFVADEVAQVVDGVITGEADAVDEAGEIVPQQIDMSKLVPWLTAAFKETLAQVEALTARVAELEAAQA